MTEPEKPERRFTLKDRLIFEASVALHAGHIADALMDLEGADGLDRGEAMVVADAVRRRIAETAIATVEEELGARFDSPGPRKVYWVERSLPNGGPDPCPECGISDHAPTNRRTEDHLTREDVGEHVAERLDRGMYANEDCFRCHRLTAMYGMIEVEDY